MKLWNVGLVLFGVALAACGTTSDSGATPVSLSNEARIATQVAATLEAVVVQQTVEANNEQVSPTDAPLIEASTDVPPTITPLVEQPVAYVDVPFNGSPAPGDGSNTVSGVIRMAGVNGTEDGQLVVSSAFAIRVVARVPENTPDDADPGIASVEFSIFKPDGSTYTYTEQTSAYCSFMGSESECQLQDLNDEWPDGSYQVSVLITPKDSSFSTINWNFGFIIKKT